MAENNDHFSAKTTKNSSVSKSLRDIHRRTDCIYTHMQFHVFVCMEKIDPDKNADGKADAHIGKIHIHLAYVEPFHFPPCSAALNYKSVSFSLICSQIYLRGCVRDAPCGAVVYCAV